VSSKGVQRTEAKDGVENERLAGRLVEADEEVTDDEAEPANFDGDVLGRQPQTLVLLEQ
jgi:hypothetical protein